MDTTHNSNEMNEWGEYTSISYDTFNLNREGVMEALRDQNPAITSVFLVEAAEIGESRHDQELIGNIDWAEVGQCLGNSQFLNHLTLKLSGEALSLEKAELFCKGLVVNSSIRYLTIEIQDPHHYWDDFGEDDSSDDETFTFTANFFTHLLPFFQMNVNLDFFCLKGHLESYHSSIDNVIVACQSLKSLSISVFGRSDMDWYAAIKSIGKKKGLQHLTIEGDKPSKKACLELKKMLSSKRCALTSLALSRLDIQDDADFAQIIHGLSKNKTVKSLRLYSTYYEDHDAISQFLSSSLHARLESIETLDLSVDYNYSRYKENKLAIAAAVAAALPQMPSLKILRVDGITFDNATRGTGQIPGISRVSALHEIQINEADTHDIIMNRLQTSTNTSLKTLHLPNIMIRPRDCFDTPWWCHFFSVIKTPALEVLTMAHIHNDNVMRTITPWLAWTPKLRVLKIGLRCDITATSKRSLAASLESLKYLEELDIEEMWDWVGDDPSLGIRGTSIMIDLLENTLRTLTSLKRLRLSITGIDQLQTVMNLVARPECQIEEMKIRYTLATPAIQNYLSPEQVIVYTLRRNTSLKVLWFDHKRMNGYDFDWQAFNDLLCNCSNIESTYDSNHTIQIVVAEDSQRKIPLDIHSLFCLNRNSNKHAVAREKIMRYHSFEDVKFVSASLPVVLSWFGMSESDKALNQVYSILRKRPHTIQSSNSRKRKIQYS